MNVTSYKVTIGKEAPKYYVHRNEAERRVVETVTNIFDKSIDGTITIETLSMDVVRFEELLKGTVETDRK